MLDRWAEARGQTANSVLVCSSPIPHFLRGAGVKPTLSDGTSGRTKIETVVPTAILQPTLASSLPGKAPEKLTYQQELELLPLSLRTKSGS